MGTKGDLLTNVATVPAEGLQRSLSRLGDIRFRKIFGGYGVIGFWIWAVVLTLNR